MYIENYIKPISEDNPCGRDLREDTSVESIYYKLRDARNSARKTERLALADAEDAGAVDDNWFQLKELALQALEHETKDLEVVAWLIEALTRIDGIKGLSFGYRIANELISSFWDKGIYPAIDEDGIETRVAPLSGLNGFDGAGTLITPIKSVAITDSEEYLPVCVWQYEQAVQLERLDAEKKQNRIDNGAIPLESIKKAVLLTEPSFYRELVADVQSALETYETFTNEFDRVCDSLPQPTSNIRNALKECIEAVEYLARDKLASSDELVSQDSKEGVTDSPGAEVRAINRREQAVNTLRQVAQYFRETEPHSPISYLLEQSIRWSDLSLPELLQQLIPEEGAREQYFKLTGIDAGSNQ
ncbi:type VI secretion system protein TssA [Kangiella koreensis]|uniref:Type VI secretion-associated protein, ImpA family n=1 Tax=Kangiella koreensis (strain DSM 16069 / JCM 12317 / KCTC 12182 / SW-125) TaxID=523791 RepID=C7R9B5_KANKD|nr:type VI secretion system protein TssA [Kangiella koreensis]ACV27905.1 type VI secretion-associated protein, ImpA family [Kangiella koreensis DSM 16069]